MTANPQTLLAAMHARAEEDKAACLADAAERARTILAAADAKIAALRKESEVGLKREVRAERDRITGESTLYARRKILEAKRKLLNAAFQRAREDLEGLVGAGKHLPALARLIDEAAAALGDGAELEIAAADGAVLKALDPRLRETCHVTTAAHDPGTVKGTSKDGRQTVENSLRRRLERLEALRAADVARVLFGSISGGTEAASLS